ncbi:MAG: ArsR/SmtB family transcription factor [Thermoleophilaceae bacterium]
MADGDTCELLCLDLEKAEALRRERLPLALSEPLANSARALGDPTRLALAAALRDVDELCVCDLAWVVERSHKLVSHHVRQLRAAELVRSRREGKMVMYSLSERGCELLDAVLAGAAAPA